MLAIISCFHAVIGNSSRNGMQLSLHYFQAICWNQGSVVRQEVEMFLELHNNGEPVYCITHRICE